MSDNKEGKNEPTIEGQTDTSLNNENAKTEAVAIEPGVQQQSQQSKLLQQHNDSDALVSEEVTTSASTPTTSLTSSPSQTQTGSTPATSTAIAATLPNSTAPPTVKHTPQPAQTMNAGQPPPPRLPTSQPTSMTLLDNLTAQLSPDRKSKFLELFRKLQNNAVTVPDFLSQARMLLDQQQYQQIENLKNKPAQQPQQRPPSIPLGPPTVQSQQQQQQIPHLQPISSSQVRAEDAQRAMMPGFINAQQGKKTKAGAAATDIPKSLPLFRPGQPAQVPQQLTLQQQQFLQQQQMKQHLLQQHLMQQQRLQLQAQSTKSNKKPVTQQQQQQQQASPTLTTTPTMTVSKQQQQQQQTDLQELKIEEELEDLSQQPNISQDFMNTEMLRDKLKKYTSAQRLELEPDVITLIALATEKRLERLIQHMIEAFKHRTESQTFTQPPIDEKTGHHPFKIVDVQDIKKQLLAIERVEREEERKRKEMILEKERKAQLGEDGGHDGSGDATGSQGAGGVGDDGERPKKKKKKEMGPSVSARYMSDDVRNKTTNETALMIAGGVMKSWMLTGMNSTGSPSSASFGSNRDKSSTAPVSRQNSNNPSGAIKMEQNTESPNAILSPTPVSSTTAIDPTSTMMQQDDQSQQQSQQPQQPRGRGRPRRRKSGSGPDGAGGKKMKAFSRPAGDSGLFLPPSTIGRPHRLGEHATRKITVRDAVYVLEEEYENNMFNARRTLLKVYSNHFN